MVKWGPTCNQNYLYRWLPCQYFTLLMMGAWRPKHVEKVCSNKICILLHHIGVLFNLTLFFIGQLSSFEVYAISFSLSSFGLLQSHSRWSTVRFPLRQGHSGDSIILNRCRYDLVFPWAVVIAVKLGVRLIFVFSLSLLFGEDSLVANPLVVWSHCCSHFSKLFCLSWCSISLFGILL